MKVEVAVLGPNKPYGFCARTLKLMLFTERPGLPVPNGPYGLRGRKATQNEGIYFNPDMTFVVD